MKILALESSAKAASVALCDGGALVAQYFHNSGLTHSTTLLKMAQDVLDSLGLTVRDTDLVAVASGPGSFTGIRIGVSAAIGLAWGAQLPVCGVSTLEAMAHQPEQTGHIICPVMDARRGQVYTASFDCDGDTLTRLTPDRAISIDALLAEAAAADRPYLLLGDGAQLCQTAFLKGGVDCVLAPVLIRQQTAWGVARAAMGAPRIKPDALRPNYLRVSQAERERAAKQDPTALKGRIE